MLVDTHCHLNFAAFDADWRQVADEAVKSGVAKMIVVGADLTSSAKAVELAKKHNALYAAVGIHPHHADGPADLSEIKKLAQNKKVVAIGEIGLDYHVYLKTKYPDNSVTPELKVKQKQLFGAQIQLAKELNLPLIIHNREANEEVLDAIEHFSKSDGKIPAGVFHCISGSVNLLKKILEMGFYVGIDANVTYSQEVQILVKAAPLNKILVETDSPFLSPKNARGLRNTPVNVRIGAAFLAKLKQVDLATVAKATTINAQQLFNL